MATYRYSCSECGATYIGEQVSGVKLCGSGHKMTGSPYVIKMEPLSSELQTSYDITAANKLRNQLCENWGIANKSHKTHGSNLSGSQTLARLIDNIVEPVAEGANRERIRMLVSAAYHYDIDTKGMV